jgi:hypothetical protein
VAGVFVCRALPGPGNALVFPSNGAAPVGTLVVFQFTGANLPNIQPLTLVWRYKPQQQTGFYATFFHGKTGAFSADQDYFGCHPYPHDGVATTGSSGTDHRWEISIEGVDDVVDENAADPEVIKNQWYTQAAVCRSNGAGQSIVDFYWDLGTGTSRIISHTTVNGALSNAASNPGLTFGDAPWSAGQERLSGSLGQVKIFNTNLSQADIVSEAGNMTTIVTSAGNTNRWWYKNGFTGVDDLTDSVTGKVAAWNNANKATLGEQL